MAKQEYDIMKPMVGIMMIGVMAALIIPMITPPEPPPPTYCCAVCEELGVSVCFYTYAELEAHFAAEHPGEPVEPVASPAISVSNITWESEDGLTEFEIGSIYAAKVVMTNPTTGAFDYSAALYIGTNQVLMDEIAFHLDAGESKEVSFSVTMPEAPGEYPVCLTVSSGGVLLGYYQAASITVVGAPVAEFYMPSEITDISIREHDILQWHYWEITYRLPITNRGGAPASYNLEWKHDYDGIPISESQVTISLSPGETYIWSDKMDIDFTRAHQGRVRLYGAWPENNYSEGIVIEGVPT